MGSDYKDREEDGKLFKGGMGFKFLSAYQLVVDHIKAHYPESVVILLENASWLAERMLDEKLQTFNLNLKGNDGFKQLQKTMEFDDLSISLFWKACEPSESFTVRVWCGGIALTFRLNLAVSILLLCNHSCI